VHRIGRTGRAGNNGIAISFCAKDEETYWKDIVKLTKISAKEIKDHPYPWGSSEAEKDPTAPPPKPDLRNKNQQAKSRKSPQSKQNKKRWY
jgi:ATP-dependent RNA helicase RhlE